MLARRSVLVRSGTVFGARGSGSFFSRATAILATAFFVSSLTLAYLSSQRSAAPESLLEDAAIVEEQTEEAPVINEEMPVSDMPSLESSDDEPAIPALEEESRQKIRGSKTGKLEAHALVVELVDTLS